MKYNEAALIELQESLSGVEGKLKTQAAALLDAATKLEQSWEGNEGLAGFTIAKNAFDAEFGRADGEDPNSTIGHVRKLEQAVGNALINAKSADKGVEGAFRGA
ncbi:hypothetical protein HLB23_18765 [Nocardia uniformis]|uniref:WXG100 family type VII secretion target n=1 Tax=Nocardia uniformis TaxID=53432 RepID=A0A849BZW4_9NOCA|nr:hypothetical protein [Nocardia uniformis]NNH71874.1 hypothetical protein [Nocardia uniformis]